MLDFNIMIAIWLIATIVIAIGLCALFYCLGYSAAINQSADNLIKSFDYEKLRNSRPDRAIVPISGKPDAKGGD